MFRFVEVTAVTPSCLSKQFGVDPTGNFVAKPGGRVSKASARVVTVETPAEFLDIIRRADATKAFMYGVPTCLPSNVTEFEIWQKASIEKLPEITLDAKPGRSNINNRHVISRTRGNFGWPDGSGGIMMLDYDPLPGEDVLDPDKLREKLWEAAPGLESAPYVMQPSNSSFLMDARTGAWIKESRGYHIYFFVRDPHLIEEAGKRLFSRLWVQGHGRCITSDAGIILQRSIVDASVWQPERLDFCGAPICKFPIVRKAPPAALYNEESAPAVLSSVLPELTKEEAQQYEDRRIKARNAIYQESISKKAVWVARRSEEIKGKDGSNHDLTNRQRTFIEAVERGVLYRDFPIILASGKTVTIGEILESPKKYNKTTCRDPLEPNYHNGALTGWINTESRPPYLRSLAHGGARYTLSAERTPTQDTRSPHKEGAPSSKLSVGRAPEHR